MIVCDNYGAGQLLWAQLAVGERISMARVELEDRSLHMGYE